MDASGGHGGSAEDLKWMQLALRQARQADQIGEVPVGAVLVKGGQILAEDHNRPISTNDPTAHAEILVLKAAAQKLKNYRLIDTTLYVTLEPCAMCAGAMMLARINRLVYGAADPKTGAAGSVFDVVTSDLLNHRIDCVGGVLGDDCGRLLQRFFSVRR